MKQKENHVISIDNSDNSREPPKELQPLFLALGVLHMSLHDGILAKTYVLS